MVSLASYNYRSFDRGCSLFVRVVWMLLGRHLVRTSLQPFSGIRIAILKLFGSRIGKGVCLKPGVRVTAPWRLSIGNNSWIGEDCWIDNLGQITIENDVCISQDVYLVTGNHDWSDPAFKIFVKPIHIGQGAWIGAKSIVTAGIKVGAFGIATAGSVVTKDIGESEIWAGNPAKLIKHRRFKSQEDAGPTELIGSPSGSVLVVGPAPESKGGVASVIAAHMQAKTWRTFGCELVPTYLHDRGKGRKLAITLTAYLRSLVKMPFASLVHIHLAGESSLLRKLPVVALAKFWRKPVLVHVHAYSPDSLFKKTPRWATRYVLTAAKRIIALSEQWRQVIDEHVPAGKTTVIHNPAMMPNLSDGIDSRPPVVVFLGRLEPRKGVSDLIHAAQTVLQTVPDAKFLLAGTGEVEKAETLSQQLGISASIQCLGWISREGLPNLLAQAAVFCLPSYDEGVPMSVLEAMSAGIPVVTTPVGGIPSFIQDGVSGILVQPGDTVSLARELTRLLQNPGQLRSQLGAAGRQVATDRCSLAKIEHDLQILYQELIGPPDTVLVEPDLSREARVTAS